MQQMLVLPLLFGTGFAAGMVDAMAGGGGLITVPALLAVGLPPQQALGTNKLQSSFGSFSATLKFVRSGAVHLNDCARGILFTGIGASAGACAVQLLDPGLLRRLIPFLLISLAAYLLLSPKLGYEEVRPRMRENTFHLLFGLGIGFYDGFFGPGTGTFWVMAYMLLLGYGITRATAHTKVMNFTSNIASLLFFIIGGQVHYREGLVMGAGQFLGARVGAKLVLRKGAPLVKPVLLVMALAISAKLLIDNFR